MPDSPTWVLLADIGGTHTRLALCQKRLDLTSVKVYKNSAFNHLAEIVEHHLRDWHLKQNNHPPVDLVGRFAVACPVDNDVIRFTNLPWTFSRQQLQIQLGLRELSVVNDFTAIALAIPSLTDQDRISIGEETATCRAAMGIIGPGTGLGMGGLIPHGSDDWSPLTSEGGHATLAANSDEEEEVLRRLRQRFGHVSAERVLAGPGLLLLYRCLAEISAQPATLSTPKEVTESGLLASDPLAEKALDMYLGLLGSVAGDLALILGAKGGIYLAGGILPQLRERLHDSTFRQRFMDKGRFQEYLATIPTYLITHPYPALIGLHPTHAE